MNGNQDETVRLDKEELKKVQNFKYLVSVVNITADTQREVKYKIQCGWIIHRNVSGVICYRRVPAKLKEEVHRAVDRPALAHGLDAAPMTRKDERKIDIS